MRAAHDALRSAWQRGLYGMFGYRGAAPKPKDEPEEGEAVAAEDPEAAAKKPDESAGEKPEDDAWDPWNPEGAAKDPEEGAAKDLEEGGDEYEGLSEEAKERKLEQRRATRQKTAEAARAAPAPFGRTKSGKPRTSKQAAIQAKSRRVGGASYFTVGRDPAGMPYSSEPYYSKGGLEGEDLYHPDHGRYVLMSSPGVGDMAFLGFEKVYYDKRDHNMRLPDASREDDFISISGSKMRKLAAIGAKPCPPTIPSDLIAAKCIPPGFMVQKGWEIVSDYYIRQKTGDWVPYSKQLGGLSIDGSCSSTAETPYGHKSFAVTFKAAPPVEESGGCAP